MAKVIEKMKETAAAARFSAATVGLPSPETDGRSA